MAAMRVSQQCSFQNSSLCFQHMPKGGWNVCRALIDHDLQIRWREVKVIVYGSLYSVCRHLTLSKRGLLDALDLGGNYALALKAALRSQGFPLATLFYTASSCGVSKTFIQQLHV